MTTIPFYGHAHEVVAALEVTITKRNGRYLMAFVEDDELQLCAPMDSGIDPDDVPEISYVTDYHARVAVWGYVKLWTGQGMAVVYRGDLETV